MKGKPIQNLAASVYARLLKRTDLGDEDFQFVLMRYGAERLMYRLSQSEHAANFVLKGQMCSKNMKSDLINATRGVEYHPAPSGRGMVVDVHRPGALPRKPRAMPWDAMSCRNVFQKHEIGLDQRNARG